MGRSLRPKMSNQNTMANCPDCCYDPGNCGWECLDGMCIGTFSNCNGASCYLDGINCGEGSGVDCVPYCNACPPSGWHLMSYSCTCDHPCLNCGTHDPPPTGGSGMPFEPREITPVGKTPTSYRKGGNVNELQIHNFLPNPKVKDITSPSPMDQSDYQCPPEDAEGNPCKAVKCIDYIGAHAQGLITWPDPEVGNVCFELGHIPPSFNGYPFLFDCHCHESFGRIIPEPPKNPLKKGGVVGRIPNPNPGYPCPGPDLCPCGPAGGFPLHPSGGGGDFGNPLWCCPCDDGRPIPPVPKRRGGSIKQKFTPRQPCPPGTYPCGTENQETQEDNWDIGMTACCTPDGQIVTDVERPIPPAPKRRGGNVVRGKTNPGGPLTDPCPPCCQNPGYINCNCGGGYVESHTCCYTPPEGISAYCNCEGNSFSSFTCPQDPSCPDNCPETGGGSWGGWNWWENEDTGGWGPLPPIVNPDPEEIRTIPPVEKPLRRGGRIIKKGDNVNCPNGYTGIDQFGNNIC